MVINFHGRAAGGESTRPRARPGFKQWKFCCGFFRRGEGPEEGIAPARAGGCAEDWNAAMWRQKSEFEMARYERRLRHAIARKVDATSHGSLSMPQRVKTRRRAGLSLLLRRAPPRAAKPAPKSPRDSAGGARARCGQWRRKRREDFTRERIRIERNAGRRRSRSMPSMGAMPAAV